MNSKWIKSVIMVTALALAVCFALGGCSGKSYTLKVEDVDLSDAPNVVLENKPYNLGGWKPEDMLRFSFSPKKTGEYKIKLVYSKMSGDGDTAEIVLVNPIGPCVYASLPATGDDWSVYEEFTVERTIYYREGDGFLHVYATDDHEGEHVINLREITLTFVE